MPTADLRVFRCTTGYNAAGELIVDQVEVDDLTSMSIWVPELLEVNALAAPLGRPLAYRVKQHELNLVLSFLDTPRFGMVTARRDDLKSAARHISAFVVESVGMGMLTATMRDFYQWTGDHDHLEHFDALPKDLLPAYQKVGVRPDLLFRDPAGAEKGVAGEARGRSTRPSPLLKPLAAQRKRLDKILGWSQRHTYHPVTMAWTYLGGTGLSVDLFDVVFPPPAQRRPAPSPPPIQPEPPVSGNGPTRPEQPPGPSDVHESGLGVEQPDISRPSEQRRIRAVADDYDSGMSLSVNFTGTVDNLYETAPAGGPEQVLDGAQVRGDWVSADLLGASTTQLFLGVLPEEPSTTLQQRIRERRTDPERSADRVQADVFGRLIVAVSLDSDSPPRWEEVADRLS
ncbi:hypothetical protein SAMN04489727_9143 [Amycolatopsis tolypomycina]|uniref:Uncharacterized protein n=1 Tax=Amycolatopsis tolypomycina TaxID=208445 RepID=A0A1H5D3Y9_9PSEU|nr:hypothetical protein [Amycolatopsis tolypomycina]SED73562.1 hypothetical protein SAMN04489727_9143 [Amycolatopsis tolypomycina]